MCIRDRVRNLSWSLLILAGIFLLQVPHLKRADGGTVFLTLVPILVAAFSYPLGNRKMMACCPPSMSTIKRVFGMTLCSMPFWLLRSLWAAVRLSLIHILDEVRTLSDRLLVIYEGEIVSESMPGELDEVEMGLLMTGGHTMVEQEVQA